MVGEESVLMTDPINADAAPVTEDGDPEEVRCTSRPLSGVFAQPWRSRFGSEVWTEASSRVVAREKAAEDLRRDRAPTALPELVFNDRIDIDFEGRQVSLRYHSPNNGAATLVEPVD